MFALARSDPRVGKLLEEWLAAAELSLQLDTILTDLSRLFSNLLAQPLIVAATLATWEALKDVMPKPALVAGYSIGELAAYGVSGALEPADAVCLASTRARLMDACTRSTPAQVLIAVSGLDIGSAHCLQAADYFLAIDTGDDTFIAGGPVDRLAAVKMQIAGLGGHVTVLPVEVASHTPFMQAAVAPFEKELRQHCFKDPPVPVLSGITAEMITHSQSAVSHLSRQIAEPILWRDCMDACAEAGITLVLELGPGAALSRMFHARHPHIQCRSVAEFRSLAGVKQWLDRQLD